MRDALSGPDGTQPLAPPPTYPDVLGGGEIVRSHIRPAQPVAPPRLTEHERAAAVRPRRAARHPAKQTEVRVEPASDQRAGGVAGKVVGCLTMLVVLGGIALGVVHRLLVEYGILGP
ncbi:hypothetical protein A8924_0773 [Saccharopolyspora erythraea NRRL 2338]|uniref:Uncharacterized protein n=2 Tax=Saccharopolyspora erythraea TaxID=1836 RepID=A4F6Q2_SACEN|nr:hypothetical protein [Saccharopolyspora erythraea]EQD87303.1 hypothetical protein N599_05220 [Saccharopolyspora erythraea D]PFG93529.1 hypothetical protein A8924_0773 [Saccharopolyspora erythraea NRRL 2338]QRK90385.1 hypothetical protein JQX30_02365 [Saccharopolyspora erythraea]CAL99726.1 hypothetical protein SACE_0378 [Saccharopolyspora erythraea NRRL 2338]